MLGKLIPACLLAITAMAAVVADVETAMSHGNFPLAESMLQSYRSQRGTTPEYLEALSWLARGDLITRQFDQADARAKETEKLAVQALAARPLDAEPHLPLALGAAVEVEAQVLTANGDRAGALALLRKDLITYGKTSIRTRIQKNINLLTLEGRPAPALLETRVPGRQAHAVAGAARQTRPAVLLGALVSGLQAGGTHPGPDRARLRAEGAGDDRAHAALRLRRKRR